jgi:hypothetical protein
MGGAKRGAASSLLMRVRPMADGSSSDRMRRRRRGDGTRRRRRDGRAFTKVRKCTGSDGPLAQRRHVARARLHRPGDDPADRSVQLTHADAICWLTPTVTSYTHDTLALGHWVCQSRRRRMKKAEMTQRGWRGGGEGGNRASRRVAQTRLFSPPTAALFVAASLT